MESEMMISEWRVNGVWELNSNFTF